MEPVRDLSLSFISHYNLSSNERTEPEFAAEHVQLIFNFYVFSGCLIFVGPSLCVLLFAGRLVNCSVALMKEGAK